MDYVNFVMYETVEHYLIDCNGQTDLMSLILNENDNECDYNVCRNILKARLKRIDGFFKNPSHFNVTNLLFPHSWQRKPYYSDPNYKLKKVAQVKRRVNILKEIINFVKATKRFKGEKFGF